MASDPDRYLEAVLAARIRGLARRKRVPLTHLADRAAISRSQLWAVLNGEHSATLALVQKLARVLEVSPLALLEGEPTAELKPLRKRASSPEPVAAPRLAANPTKPRAKAPRRAKKAPASR